MTDEDDIESRARVKDNCLLFSLRLLSLSRKRELGEPNRWPAAAVPAPLPSPLSSLLALLSVLYCDTRPTTLALPSLPPSLPDVPIPSPRRLSLWPQSPTSNPDR